MSIVLVTPDRIEAVAFENPGTQIHMGAHAAQLVVGDLMYVAPLDGVA